MRKGKSKEKIEKYFEQQEELYKSLLSYIENSIEESICFKELKKVIASQNILQKRPEFEHFLRLITSISNHYHRDSEFFEKIEQILVFYEDEIEQTFSNSEILQIFMSNKLLLLFLFDRNIVAVDETVIQYFLEEEDQNGFKYCHFFLPEIGNFVDDAKFEEIENEIAQFDPEYYKDYDQKRHKGENEKHISTLIRLDKVEEFIAHVNYYKISFDGEIQPSMYETNNFLIDKNPRFIEYAAFFGSIQIFRFLFMNNVEVNCETFVYAIHSKNAELIHFFEYNQIDINSFTFERIFLESIKCHHNDISVYIEDNLIQRSIDISNEESKDNENIISTSIEHYNYLYFPKKFDLNFSFFYLYKCRYFNIVKLFLKTKKKEIDKIII